MESKADLMEFLAQMFPSATVAEGNQYAELSVPAEKWHETARQLREDGKRPFDFLIDLTAVDYLSKFTVVCHLESTVTHDLIVLKADLEDRVHPHIETLSDIWATAEFHEREIWDLFGIRFDRHPDLRRLFMEEGDGFPLRKDYKDEINIIELPN